MTVAAWMTKLAANSSLTRRLAGRMRTPRPVGCRATLPAPVEPLIGRDAEAIALRDLLTDQDVRLVTLTGPGGIGKTRLAQHVAAELGDHFPHGVFFVPLASLADPDLVITTIVRVLGLADAGARPLAARLDEYARDRALLLVRDNFEHVLSAALAVADLLAAATRIKLLVTSRAVLRLRGEHVVALSGLALPDADRPTRVADLVQHGATRLFVDRAAAASSEFAVAEASAPAIAAVCRRLDGVPLAIELAATRARLLSPAVLLAHLESALGALPLLVGGARDLPARQQTLRGAIGWSYDLLDPDERRLFQRLAVFDGGCTPEAVEALYERLGDGPFDALPGLGALVDQSLLRREQPPGSGETAVAVLHFRMLETIRAFALERLAVSVEAAAVRRAHAQYYLALAEDAASNLTTGAQAFWLERLDLEQENLRAALTWSLDEGEVETALRLGGALWRFWYTRGYLSEGRHWLDRALTADAGAPTLARARALAGAGILACYQSDQAAAVTLCGESRAICRALGDRAGVAAALNGLALAARMGGDYPAARASASEALAIMRELGDKVGATLFHLAEVASLEADHAGARASRRRRRPRQPESRPQRRPTR